MAGFDSLCNEVIVELGPEVWFPEGWRRMLDDLEESPRRVDVCERNEPVTQLCCSDPWEIEKPSLSQWLI
jgi:hypothetical protein